MILISACLLGKNCKYSGGNNKNPGLISLLKDKSVISVCPEELGGLPTPRLPAEISGGTGIDVIHGKAKVCFRDGTDVTRNFIKGAIETQKYIQFYPVKLAIMKEGSPSCGVNRIYDGSFKGISHSGSGVTTALLKDSGIKVISEETPLTGDILALIAESE
ncbi:MAG: DUF523 domain-containing protein [Bacillota bacterium]|jgi:uncharacterized protein YbbK (DUF523 family)|nr:DUF523 domain-containing protein [Clostridia bacterium]